MQRLLIRETITYYFYNKYFKDKYPYWMIEEWFEKGIIRKELKISTDLFFKLNERYNFLYNELFKIKFDYNIPNCYDYYFDKYTYKIMDLEKNT